MTGPSPVDRARTGSKHHLLTDSGGIPLAMRSERLLADRGHDHDKYRREFWRRGVKPVIARRSIDHRSGVGRERWVVERTFAHLHNLRRLRIRYERDDQLHLAFMLLGRAAVCQRRLIAA